MMMKYIMNNDSVDVLSVSQQLAFKQTVAVLAEYLLTEESSGSVPDF